MNREFWVAYDTRSGKRASVTTYFTQEQAETAIASWKVRDAKGGRKDIHDLMPFLASRPLEENEW